MLVYTFDHTLDGVLSAVFDAYFRHQSPDMLIGYGDQLPLFCDEVWEVITTDEKATRVWKGMEKHMSREALRLISISWLSEEKEKLATGLLDAHKKVSAEVAYVGANKDDIK